MIPFIQNFRKFELLYRVRITHALLGIDGSEKGQDRGIMTRMRKCLGVKDVYIILTVLLVSWVYTYL